MSRPVLYGITISEEILGSKAPVLIQGGLVPAIHRAAGFGFDSVEIHVRNPTSIDVLALEQAAGQSGIDIAAVGTGFEYSLNHLCLTSPDTVVRRKTAERFREHIDLAARLGATVFVGLCRGTAPKLNLREEYLDRFAGELAPITEYATSAGVVLSLEPIASYMTNLLNTTVETFEFLKRPGLEPVMLLMDTHHMYLEDGDMHQTFLSCRGRIAHLHISDSDRRYPGSGEIDYGQVGESLKEIGYDRAVSLEVPCEPDCETAMLAGLKWMRGVWGDSATV